ncbi:MAG: hypothetical protein Q7S82_01820 [bacterium]|nr:hypothetical protein [bacterium]
MQISVYSLKNTLFKDQAKSLTCNTSLGEITVLNNHEPLISDIKEGVIKIIDKDEKLKYIPVKEGFIEINSNNEIRCMVEER